MTKGLFSIFITVCIVVTTAYAQSADRRGIDPRDKAQREASQPVLELQASGLSPTTALLLVELKTRERQGVETTFRDTAFIEQYGLLVINEAVYVNAFLVFSGKGNSTDKLENKGVTIHSRFEDMATAVIPLEHIEAVAELPGIKYVHAGKQVETAMDNARSDTWTHWVHQGVQLPDSYYGEGVVTGIIDRGFDYTHTGFFDETGANNYRVKRVWEQDATTGTPPAGYSYGRELTTQAAILNAQRDHNNASHGTHVAGIAAGAGGGVNSTYTGIAPKSDLVLVSRGNNAASIADGIEYIMNYASSVNKPCVINLSLGSHIGPHDGTSPFDQFCDAMVGPGKLIVGSAGNSGMDSLFLEKSYSMIDTILLSFLKFPDATFSTMNNGSGVVDIWGVPNELFYVAISIFNTNTNQFEDWTPYIPVSSSNTYSYTLYDNDFWFPDPVPVTIHTEVNPLNNKPNAIISVDNTAQDDSYRWILLEVIAYNTQTQMWGWQSSFSDLNYLYPVESGSTSSTVGEIGGTSNSVITVGAYTSKNSWTALNGSPQSAPFYAPNGAIAPFSSKGPTADNRTKPDITAPGNVVVSSVSRFDNDYPPGDDRVVSGVTDGTNSWFYAAIQGTSMSAPVVTGILALWLEVYPDLTLDQAVSLLQDNAWTDNFTGNIPAQGCNTWGWGKVDAHEGMKDLVSSIPNKPGISPSGPVSMCQGETVQLSAPGGYSGYEWSNGSTSQNITVSSQGYYAVRVETNQGFYSAWSDNTNVGVNPNPSVPSITVDNNILSSSASSGNQWYLDGQAIPGATQQSYVAQQSGDYYVVVTNAHGCSAESSVMPVTLTNVNDWQQTSEIQVYPNPSDGELNIKFVGSKENAWLKLYDISGRLLTSWKVNPGAPHHIEVLNLDHLEVGTYKLHVITTDNHYVYPIVKIR